MALPQLIPSSPSSSSFTHYKPTLNPNALLSSSLNPNSIFKSSLLLRRRRKSNGLRCSSSSYPERNYTNSPKSDDVVELHSFLYHWYSFPGPFSLYRSSSSVTTDLRFGVIYSDAVSGTADVGCVGEVVKHERLVDDRFFLICKGQERFRIGNIVRTKPYLVAEVTWLEDRPSPDGEEDLDSLANEVESYMKDVIRLSNRLGGKPEKEVQDLRRNLFPTPFRFSLGAPSRAPRESSKLCSNWRTRLPDSRGRKRP
ncbi:hypothetical protein F8388_014561 [Cannabis sativa]|uniref:Lon N-terminal domain-containing protein n=1 Tax=Cannabis sativa TaxID=3483 RepID=A0A7J6EIT7_CANSA|nr:hypothetical protein F8388_014561 [Cannabis sativa]